MRRKCKGCNNEPRGKEIGGKAGSEKMSGGDTKTRRERESQGVRAGVGRRGEAAESRGKEVSGGGCTVVRGQGEASSHARAFAFSFGLFISEIRDSLDREGYGSRLSSGSLFGLFSSRL